jgi:hypothetical protein
MHYMHFLRNEVLSSIVLVIKATNVIIDLEDVFSWIDICKREEEGGLPGGSSNLVCAICLGCTPYSGGSYYAVGHLSLRVDISCYRQ